MLGIDFQRPSGAMQPVDQARLFRPVVTFLVKDGRLVGGCLGESAIAGFGNDRVNRAEQVSKTQPQRFGGDCIRVSYLSGSGCQPANLILLRPVFNGQAMGNAAHRNHDGFAPRQG